MRQYLLHGGSDKVQDHRSMTQLTSLPGHSTVATEGVQSECCSQSEAFYQWSSISVTLDLMHQCLLPASASFHGSFSGKQICVGSHDEGQWRNPLSIHELGDLVAAPNPLKGTQNANILAESDFNLFVLRRVPDAKSDPLAQFRLGFLNNFVCKVFAGIGRACPPSWRKTARQRGCCKFHLMQQGHPTGWVKPAAIAILGEAQLWMIKNEALRGLSASSIHPGTFSPSRPSTSHCEAGRHFPGMSRTNPTNEATLGIPVAPAMQVWGYGT